MISIKTVTQREECLSLYKKFVPAPSHIFEVLEFRDAFNEGENLTPQFLVAQEDGDDVALLTLAHSAEKNRTEWWGSVWMEGMKIYTLPELSAESAKAAKMMLLGHISQPYTLESWFPDPDLVERLVDQNDPKYTMPIAAVDPWEAYLQTRSSKSRNTLRRKLKTFGDAPIVVKEDPFLLEKMFEWNISRFMDKGGSSFGSRTRRQAYRNIVMQQTVPVKVFGIYVGDALVSIFCVAFFEKTMSVLNAGHDYAFNEHTALLMFKIVLEYGSAHGYDTFDFLSSGEENSYKKDLRFIPTTLYKLT